MKRWITLTILMIIGLNALLLIDIEYRAKIHQENVRALAQASTDAQNRLQEAFKMRLQAVENLQAFMLAPTTLPDNETFNHFAAGVLDHSPTIRGLAYIDSDRIIRYFYPLEGNEAAIGLDLMTRPAAPFVEKAIQELRTTVNNPTVTVQGSLSVIPRAPLYRGNQLLGLVEGVFDVSAILEDVASGADPRFVIQLQDANGNRFWGVETFNYDTQTLPIQVGDNAWTLTLGWQSPPPGPMPITLGLIWGMGGSLLLSLLFIVNRTWTQTEWLRATISDRTVALRESEEKYKSISEDMPVLICRFLPDGEISYVNDAYCRYFEKDKSELVGENFLSLVAERDRNTVWNNITSLNINVPIQTHEHQVITTDDDIHWQRWTNRALFNDQGRIIAYQAIGEDITGRKQAEKEIMKLHNAVEQSPDIVFITDRDGILEYVNPAFESISGYSKEEVIGKSPNILSSGPMESEYAQRIWKTILSGEVFRGEIMDRKKNGEIFYYDQTISPLKDANGDITNFVSTGKDITERKEAEKQIRNQLRRLASLRAIDTTIAGSFDLNTTLNVVTKQTLDQLDVDAARVLLLDSSMQTFRYIAGNGFGKHNVDTGGIRLSESLARRIALERRIIQVTDPVQLQDDPRLASLWESEEFSCYCAVPLISKGKVKGVLEIFSRTLHLFNSNDQEWMNFLETLAGQAAIAIDNIQLFDGMQRANMELAAAYNATIEGWSQAMDLRDKETEGHTQRVTEMAERLAQAMGVSDSDLIHIRRGALLHDIGKMGVSDAILLKPDKLTDEEWVLMKKHPQFAYDMLSPIAYLKPALDIPYCHHEKWDGTGYPRGLKGEQIPLAARLFAIVDVYDALRSDRPYRQGWSDEKVIEHIRSLAGTHFDPKAVDVFLNMIPAISKDTHE